MELEASMATPLRRHFLLRSSPSPFGSLRNQIGGWPKRGVGSF